MISAKKLIKLARKWQKLAYIRRKRITLPQVISSMDESSCSTPSKSEKGHFVVYSADQRRFLLPLKYLNNDIVKELLKPAEEEFGLPINGPLTFPCNAEFMEYVITFIKCSVTRDVAKALLITIASNHCSFPSDLHHQNLRQQSPICSF